MLSEEEQHELVQKYTERYALVRETIRRCEEKVQPLKDAIKSLQGEISIRETNIQDLYQKMADLTIENHDIKKELARHKSEAQCPSKSGR